MNPTQLEILSVDSSFLFLLTLWQILDLLLFRSGIMLKGSISVLRVQFRS